MLLQDELLYALNFNNFCILSLLAFPSLAKLRPWINYVQRTVLITLKAEPVFSVQGVLLCTFSLAQRLPEL